MEAASTSFGLKISATSSKLASRSELTRRSAVVKVSTDSHGNVPRGGAVDLSSPRGCGPTAAMPCTRGAISRWEAAASPTLAQRRLCPCFSRSKSSSSKRSGCTPMWKARACCSAGGMLS